MTLIQAQQRYIDRKNTCHVGHRARVGRAARAQLWDWAVAHGYDPVVVCQDARDMAELEFKSED